MNMIKTKRYNKNKNTLRSVKSYCTKEEPWSYCTDLLIKNQADIQINNPNHTNTSAHTKKQTWTRLLISAWTYDETIKINGTDYLNTKLNEATREPFVQENLWVLLFFNH